MLGLYLTWLFQMRPEPDLAGFRNSNLARSKFGEKMFWNQRTICLMKLMASIMLSVAIKRQYHSMLPLLCHCLPVSTNLWNSNGFCIFIIQVTLVKIANTSLDRLAALVLSIINCQCQLHWYLPNPTENLAGAWLGRISEKWADSRFAGNEIWYNPIKHGIKSNYCSMYPEQDSHQNSTQYTFIKYKSQTNKTDKHTNRHYWKQYNPALLYGW